MISHLQKWSDEAGYFLKEVATELGHPADTDAAYRKMRAVLHSLRNWISPGESLHLIASVPMIVKAIYVDGWKLSPVVHPPSIEGLLDEIRQYNPRTAEKDFGDDSNVLASIFAVLRVMRQYVDEGEIDNIREQLPQPLKPLFA